MNAIRLRMASSSARLALVVALLVLAVVLIALAMAALVGHLLDVAILRDVGGNVDPGKAGAGGAAAGVGATSQWSRLPSVGPRREKRLPPQEYHGPTARGQAYPHVPHWRTLGPQGGHGIWVSNQIQRVGEYFLGAEPTSYTAAGGKA